jgi:alginate O-acetyltransferase complex protein AlgI
LSFTSWEFWRLFALVLVGLWLLRTRTQRQLLILTASAVFYSRQNPWYLLLLATPIVVDYTCGLRIAERENLSARRRWLAVSIVTNLGLLAYFKYAGFFVENIALLTGVPLSPLKIFLPIGISFFTLKSLSYTIDVYRGTLPPCRSIWRYAMFVSYFPDLIAGPIVRASVFLPQLTRSLRPSWDRASVGTQLILLGLTKKLVIADQLAVLVDPVFETPGQFSPLTVASGVFAYSLQIYCDFSGYSDIAIGVSHLIGIDLPENFNMPYLATSLSDFWRRWHMTLSQWLRDYLYIPLGGNRHGRARTYVNLFITMLLGGLWHGAKRTFVVWGFLHGLGLATHHLWRERTQGSTRPLNGWGGRLLTYLFVCFTWVFFRSESIPTALIVLGKMAGMQGGGFVWFYAPLLPLTLIVILGHVVGTRAVHTASPFRTFVPTGGFIGGFAITAWVLALLVFSPIKSSPFIYFRF